MTPEQRDELTQAAMRASTDDSGVSFQYRQFAARATPSAILSLIVQVEALNRKNLELQRVYDERGLQIERLEMALQREKVSGLTVPQGWKQISHTVSSGGPIMATITTVFKRGAYKLTYEGCMGGEGWRLDGPGIAAPTIPAIPGTKEGA